MCRQHSAILRQQSSTALQLPSWHREFASWARLKWRSGQRWDSSILRALSRLKSRPQFLLVWSILRTAHCSSSQWRTLRWQHTSCHAFWSRSHPLGTFRKSKASSGLPPHQFGTSRIQCGWHNDLWSVIQVGKSSSGPWFGSLRRLWEWYQSVDLHQSWSWSRVPYRLADSLDK